MFAQVLELTVALSPAFFPSLLSSSLPSTPTTSQDKGGKRVQEDRVAAGHLEGGAVSMAAAFDGHAGAGVAETAARLLPLWLAQAAVRDGTTAGEWGKGTGVLYCTVPRVASEHLYRSYVQATYQVAAVVFEDFAVRPVLLCCYTKPLAAMPPPLCFEHNTQH